MSDRRKEILYSIIDNHPTHGLGDEEEKIAIEAMDQYMKECCLELIQYMCDNNLFSTCRKDGIDLFYYKGEWINKEQIFENFL